MINIGPISKLTARVLSLHLDSHLGRDLFTAAQTLQTLNSIAASVDLHWAQSALSGNTKEENVGESVVKNKTRGAIMPALKLAHETREITKTIWTLLKTLLFSTIMIADGCLSTVVFATPPVVRGNISGSDPTPFSLAMTTLHTLSNLAFVISQFGGVTTTADHGFSELKKSFYLALDIISAESSGESDTYVSELYNSCSLLSKIFL